MHGNICIPMIKLGIFEIYEQNAGVAPDFRYENCINNL